MSERTRVVIMGAAGRDFHNFNVYFRDREEYEVVAFTATQIPDIDDRTYPPELAGKLYPKGIPIVSEDELERIIHEKKVDQVVFAYSDVPHEYVMHKASIVLACGADFRLMGTGTTQLQSSKPVISICAVRTGCGKSQTTRRIIKILRSMGLRVCAIRHPMPYGDLTRQVALRYATHEDLKVHRCTIEEREEFEPHIDNGVVVYCGVDYEKILREAEKESDIIIWDGGNNDFSFYRSDLAVVVADPLRRGHELTYHPGETNFRLADVIVINKIDSASPEDVAHIRENIRAVNPKATVIEAASPLVVDNPELIKGKSCLVVEDGPTVTHGEMSFGAGVVAARKFGAAEIIDPRPYTVGTITETFRKYPKIGCVLPAMGYSPQQIKDLEATINNADADVVVIGTPIDLRRVAKINKPAVRVSYELQEIGRPDMEDIIKGFIAKHFKGSEKNDTQKNTTKKVSGASKTRKK